jgi:hypothetical protein
VLFYGRQRADLDDLRPDRESADSTAFGNPLTPETSMFRTLWKCRRRV